MKFKFLLRNTDPLDELALLPQAYLYFIEHGPARRAFVGELLLALDVLHNELAVRIIFIDGVEFCAERRRVALARDAWTLVR